MILIKESLMTIGLCLICRPKRHPNQDVYKYRIVVEDSVPSSSVGYPVPKPSFRKPGNHGFNYREVKQGQGNSP